MSGNELHDLQLLLAEARQELSPVKARLTLDRVSQRCFALVKESSSSSEAAIVGSSALSELAALELSPERRLEFRRKSIDIFKRAMRDKLITTLQVNRANRVVDLFYDVYAREEAARMRSLLSAPLQP